MESCSLPCSNVQPGLVLTCSLLVGIGAYSSDANSRAGVELAGRTPDVMTPKP